VQWHQIVTFKGVQCYPGLTYMLMSDIRALWRSGMYERQSARMSEIKNVGQTWMSTV